MTVEVRHSADPTCVELAGLAAMTLRCEAVQDPPEGDDRSVRLLVDGRQVASVYVGGSPRSSEWVSAMAARLAASIGDTGFGGGARDTWQAMRRRHGALAPFQDGPVKAESRSDRTRERATGPRTVVPADVEPADEAMNADDGGE